MRILQGYKEYYKEFKFIEARPGPLRVDIQHMLMLATPGSTPASPMNGSHCRELRLSDTG